MKKILIFILIVTGISSCRLCTFTMQPGSPRTSYPKELQGNFLYIEKHNGIKDTTFFNITETTLETNDPYLTKLCQLSDTTTLTHLGDYYFFNIRNVDSTNKYSWQVFPIKATDDALYVFTLNITKHQKKLNKYLKLNGSSQSEFIMDFEPFKNYCEKKLRKRHAIKLKKQLK